MECASFIIASLAFLLSLIAFVKSNAAAKTANDLTKGQVEMQIREMITSAKTRCADLGIQLSGDLNNETIKLSIVAALEDVMNAYEEACGKYNDNKVDKERFKKSYMVEIRNIVEDENTSSKYQMPQSKFQATVKVYNEWNNIE